MVAKVAGGIVGLGLISTGGIAMAKPHWLGMDYMPSNFHSLSEDNGFVESSYSDKFGKTYKNYLVGVTHKKDKPKETNQAWWEWSYRRLKKETKNGKFKNVTNGYGGDNTKDLNKVCEEAYKQNTTALKGNDASVSDSEFKKSDVWKYCSLGGLLTHTDKDKDLYSGKIGGEESNKSKLISVKDSSNDWFWEKRNEDFWSATDTSNNWSGSKATGNNGNTSIFKTEYTGKKDNQNNGDRKTIKDLCGEAYGEEKSSKNSNNNTDALKFCVLETSGS